MAGSAPVEETPKLGKAATIFGFVFVLLILTGFSASTMMSYEDTVAEINSHHGDEHGDDYHGDDHGDDHADDYEEDDHADDHAEDDHADDHGDDHADG